MVTRVGVTVSRSADEVSSLSGEETFPEGVPGNVTEAGSTGDENRTPAAAQALLGLLRITALVTDGGWSHLLHTLFVFALGTASVAFTVGAYAMFGIMQLKDGRVIEVLAMSSFFGLMYALMWMAVACCFMVSRRQYGQQLKILGRTVSRLAGLSGNSELSGGLCRNVAQLFASVVLLIIFTFAGVFYYNIHFCTTLSATCVFSMCYIPSFSWFLTSFYLVPLKFVLASLYMQSGSQEINAHLKALTTERCRPDSATVSQLMSLQHQLSRTFTRLTKGMSLELVLVMANGTIVSVSMWILIVSSLQMGTFHHMLQMICFNLLLSTTMVVLPNEAIQRCLEATSDSRDLLLAAEIQNPHLGQQLSLFREAVGRDLDTLGDLGLFRLRRSTILSSTATTLTYVIVMVQFYVA